MLRVPASPTLLVDTASLYFRAYYGLPITLTDSDGQPANAVHGLLDMLARLIGQYSPDALVCAWDDDWRPQWRVDLVPSYKAHRVAEPFVGAAADREEVPDELERQVPAIRACLEAAGLCIAGSPDHEADDVLGTLAHRIGDGGGEAVVVTGDRDLFQLVRPAIRVAYVARGVARHELVDDTWLLARYGITGAQYVDFAVMRGDASDGLPGVTGIGEKTAAGLLRTHGDLSHILAAAADPAATMTPRIRSNLLGAADYIAAARRVVAVVADLPLADLDADLRPGRADLDRCLQLAERYRAASPMRRLLAALGEFTDT